MKTLIAEDDYFCRLALQKLLGACGECHLAVNGQEAVAVFQQALQSQQAYTLVCLDILMPEMDGQTALKAMRAAEEARGIYSRRGAKIIMTTGLDDVQNIMKAFHGLCDGYLVKPVEPTKLNELLIQLKLCPAGADSAIPE
jgi:two-component system chemotaxis response regulator CheY